MSSASSAVTYTSVYIDSEPGRQSCLLHHLRLPTLPSTSILNQGGYFRERTRSCRTKPHDPDYVPEPRYPEYIPPEDEHVLPAEEQPLPPIDSPTAEFVQLIEMDTNTSTGRLCLGESNQGFVAKGIENKEQWGGPEFQDTASSGQEKEAKVFTFYRMEEEGEHYFTPFLNLKDDDVEPSVIFGRSFMRLTKGIADFGKGIITIHPELDPFLDNSEETEKFKDDWDHLLDIYFGDIPKINEAEEAAREAEAIDIYKRFSILKEERAVIETMAYSDKYKKILDRIVMDKLKLDGEIKKEEEEAIEQVKREGGH
nr:hypothetical protein [Tanacetum cinerariifolium]